MKIQGIGIISALGRGVETLQSALENGPPEPSLVEVPFSASGSPGEPADPFPVFSVAKETLKDPVVLRGARRADRFSKMAVLAASDAVNDAGAELVPERTGVILGTAFGPHPTVFNFLDEILEFGDASVSPTLFSHSVHNAAAAYISVALGLAGPATTITTFCDPLQQSLQLAQCWIDQDVCDSVLVGCTEECGAVMEYIISQKLPIADGAMTPFFAEGGPAVIPGEGAVFFLLSRETGSYAAEMTVVPAENPDLWIVDFECSDFQESASAGCWSHLIGSSPLSTALSCASGALMLKNRTVYTQTSMMETNDGSPEKIGFFTLSKTQITLRKTDDAR